MATVGVQPEVPADATTDGDLHALASRHLWLHFTKMAAFADREVPVITRGEGCYVYDDRGKRYLDGLSALFCVNAGHGRESYARAAYEQMKELGVLHELERGAPEVHRAGREDRRARPGRPQPRLLHERRQSRPSTPRSSSPASTTSSPGNPLKTKTISRETAYHGTTMGALSITGITAARRPFEPLVPGGCHVPPTNLYRLPRGYTPEDLAESIRDRILFEGPDTVAAVFLEPVQNSGGCFVAPDGYFARVREICDEFDVLLVSDEVICSWGRHRDVLRLPADRLPAGPHHHREGPDVLLRADGRRHRVGPRRRRRSSSRTRCSATGSRSAGTRWPPPWRSRTSRRSSARTCAVACASTRAPSRRCSTRLRDLPIVGDVRGMGYFWAIELVKDRETKATFDERESDELLRGFLSAELFDRGLICRADDRGEPVIQLSPPLIAGPEQFAEMEAILRPGARRRPGGGWASPSDRHADRPRHGGGNRRARRRGRARARPRRCAGCTSPSSRTRRRGCPAASCC